MLSRIYCIALIISMFGVFACKKGDSAGSNPFVGVWELRMAGGGSEGKSTNYSSGNGRIISFDESSYTSNHFYDGQSYSGLYTYGPDTLTSGEIENSIDFIDRQKMHYIFYKDLLILRDRYPDGVWLHYSRMEH